LIEDHRRKYDINLQWFKDHYSDLKVKHEGKLCLVVDGQGEIFDDISDLIKQMKDKNADLQSTVIQYIT
jgi:hypothetical protein